MQGIVEAGDAGASIHTPEGRRYRLLLTEESAPLRSVDGHSVELWGQRALGAIRVADYKVGEGPHALQVWVGPLRQMGAQLGVEDRNTGAFYWLDQATQNALYDEAGGVVLVEGFVDGPHTLRVLHYRMLEP